jgi:hypothetical protein
LPDVAAAGVEGALFSGDAFPAMGVWGKWTAFVEHWPCTVVVACVQQCGEEMAVYEGEFGLGWSRVVFVADVVVCWRVSAGGVGQAFAFAVDAVFVEDFELGSVSLTAC